MNMKLSKNIFIFSILFCAATACTKELLTDTSFVSAASSSSKLGVMFDITQDNTGLVTITPSGQGAVSYDIQFGDGSTTGASVLPGKSARHNYAEGAYTVTIVAHDIKGGTTTFTQPLTVSFIAPQNLKVTLTASNLSVAVSATAKFATFFKIYFGDSTAGVPNGPTSALASQVINHTYAAAGTYIVKVVALSGGAETTQYLDTIHVANQINLPVTFDDPNTDYTMSDFGGNASVLSVDPANAANHVMKSVKTPGAQVWAGTTIGTALGFSSPIPLTATSTKMSVMVYVPAAGLDIKLKVEDHNDATHSVETDVKSTLSNQWETLTFDFSQQAPGTAAFNTGYIYDKASIFFDFGNAGSGSVFYFDNVKVLPPPLAQIKLPVTFEDPSIDYTVTDFGGNASVLTQDPANASNHVMQSTKTAGAQVWAGTTIGTPSGFASKIPLTAAATKMTVRVYSPAVGLDVKLKVEDHTNGANSVETDVKTTVANQWETLTFDFSQQASGTPAWNASFNYDKASIFFDFGNAGTGSVFYWDEVHFLAQVNLPVTFDNPDMDNTVSDFGNNASVLAADPTNAANNVMQTTKPSGAQTWSGTTIGTAAGCASPVPLSSSRTKMTVMVYSPAAGLDVKLKVEDHTNGANSVETDVKTTVANQWETLTFDFSQPASGTPAFNPSFTYDKISIFFDFGNAGSGKVFYWDNVIIL